MPSSINNKQAAAVTTFHATPNVKVASEQADKSARRPAASASDDNAAGPTVTAPLHTRKSLFTNKAFPGHLCLHPTKMWVIVSVYDVTRRDTSAS